jgi:hypothetical protein
MESPKEVIHKAKMKYLKPIAEIETIMSHFDAYPFPHPESSATANPNAPTPFPNADPLPAPPPRTTNSTNA